MSLFQRICLAIEHVVMTYLVPRDRPGPVWRVIFKQPIWLYKFGLGWLMTARRKRMLVSSVDWLHTRLR
jgi:hypothetical protein